MQDMLARQMAASVNSAVFPGLPHHLPLYASAPSPSLPSLKPSSGRQGRSRLPVAQRMAEVAMCSIYKVSTVSPSVHTFLARVLR